MLAHGYRFYTLAVFHTVIDRQNLDWKNLLYGCVMPFALCIHAGEGQITADHQKSAAIVDIVADQIAAVRHFFTAVKRSARQKQGVCSDIGQNYQIILFQFFHCKWKFLICQMVRKEGYFVAACLQCSFQPFLSCLIGRGIKRVKALYMGGIAHPGLACQ